MAKQQDLHTISILWRKDPTRAAHWSPMYKVPRGDTPVTYAEAQFIDEKVQEVSVYRNGRFVRSVKPEEQSNG